MKASMSRAARLFGVMFMVFSAHIADATGIVYVKFRGGYAVGADSLETKVDRLGVIRGSDYVCKLSVNHGSVFTSSGYEGAAGGLSVTDLSASVRQSIERGAHQRSLDLSSLLRSDQAFMRGLGTSPQSHVRWVFINSAEAAEGGLKSDASPLLDRILDADIMGSDPEMLPFLRQMLSPHMKNGNLITLPSRKDAVAIVRQTIAKGVEDNPQMIGGQVSILTVTRAGVYWIDRGRCDLASQATKP